jgi:hypothetical protein
MSDGSTQAKESGVRVPLQVSYAVDLICTNLLVTYYIVTLLCHAGKINLLLKFFRLLARAAERLSDSQNQHDSAQVAVVTGSRIQLSLC